MLVQRFNFQMAVGAPPVSDLFFYLFIYLILLADSSIVRIGWINLNLKAQPNLEILLCIYATSVYVIEM